MHGLGIDPLSKGGLKLVLGPLIPCKSTSKRRANENCETKGEATA